jgi:SAM-dependent methyltransferase
MRKIASALSDVLLWLRGRLLGAGEFEYRGRRLRKFVGLYNHTLRNERCIEIAVALDVLARHAGGDILEVGHVTGHYRRARHDVVDRYERAAGVQNVDIAEFRPSKRYDLILSVSTLEHIGFDDANYGGDAADPEQSGEQALEAVRVLKALLKPGGELLITLPFGYNAKLDRCVREGRLELSEASYYRCVDGDWRAATKAEAEAQPYHRGRFHWHANGLLIGTYRMPGG